MFFVSGLSFDSGSISEFLAEENEENKKYKHGLHVLLFTGLKNNSE